MKIEELKLCDEILKAVDEMGFENATPIQEKTIPLGMQGKDVIGQAHTGTGKTAAFAIPILEKINVNEKMPQAIVLCPTRELAVQVANEFGRLSKYLNNVKIVSVYGGASISDQISKIKRGVQIVVGTPGRTIDLINRRVLKLDGIKTVVIDEADEMLKMGFREDIEIILANVKKEDVQTMLFSATMPKSIKEITKKFQNNPIHIKTISSEVTSDTVKQNYVLVKESNKIEAISRIIDTYTPKLTLVFCNTKRKVDEIFEQLINRGYSCDKIHGDIKQSTRLEVLNKFNNGIINVLVATDVAARGLDIKGVETVINYDVPGKEDYYVHRIGRTGRAGKEGMSFTLAGNKDMRKIKDIERYTKKAIRKRSVPTIEKVNQIRQDKYIRNIITNAEEGITEEYKTLAQNILTKGYDPETVIASMLKMNYKIKNEMQGGDINEKMPERRKSSRDRNSIKNTTRFHINAGRQQGIRPGDILGAVAGECNIPGTDIGEIEILEKFSFFNADSKHKDTIIKKMKDNNIKGHSVKIEVTKKRKGGYKR